MVNVSLGGPADNWLDGAVADLIADHGIPVVAAAGNRSVSACGSSPARVKSREVVYES